MPYLYSAAVETHKTGVPSMRAMMLEFPADIACYDLDRQYMLGESLLVAPVFTDSGDVNYYLPEGAWTGLLDNRTVEGGRWLHEIHDYMSLPLMVRPNTLLPIGADEQNVEYDYGKGLSLHLFQLGSCARASVKDMHGKDMLDAVARKDGNEITVSFSGRAEDLSIVLRGVEKVENLTGARAEPTALGLRLWAEPGLSDIRFTL